MVPARCRYTHTVNRGARLPGAGKARVQYRSNGGIALRVARPLFDCRQLAIGRIASASTFLNLLHVMKGMSQVKFAPS